MTVKRFVQAAAITAVAFFVMAASANADEILWNTNASGTEFNGGGLTLTSTDGLATLTFTPNSTGDNNTPTNVNFGDFLLTCLTCSDTTTATFGGFTFDLIITDVTDSGATGEFVGTSSGGTVSSTSSNVDIDWAPLQIGPNGTNALTGDFGTTYFTISNVTEIVAPNSGGGGGAENGDTTVQGTVNSTEDVVPEPATMALVGGAFIGLAALARKRRRA